MELPPMLYREVEYDHPETGERRVRCMLTTMVKEGEGTTRYLITGESLQCDCDARASVQPRDARVRAPLFAQMLTCLTAQEDTR